MMKRNRRRRLQQLKLKLINKGNRILPLQPKLNNKISLVKRGKRSEKSPQKKLSELST